MLFSLMSYLTNTLPFYTFESYFPDSKINNASRAINTLAKHTLGNITFGKLNLRQKTIGRNELGESARNRLSSVLQIFFFSLKILYLVLIYSLSFPV